MATSIRTPAGLCWTATSRCRARRPRTCWPPSEFRRSPHGRAIVICHQNQHGGNIQSFDEIEAKLSDFTLTGSAALKDQTQLTGDFDVGDISLMNTMAPVFLPWNGSAQPLEETFAKTLPFGLTGVVWVRPKTLEIYPGLAVGNAQIGITAAADVTEFIASAKTEEGDDIAVEIASRPANEGRRITGRVTVPIDLFQRLKQSDGKAIAAGLATVDVRVEGAGRSPGGVLALLNGIGTFTLQDGKLLNITPENFSKLILTAKDAESLELAFAGLHSGDGITLGPVSGSVTVANGVATFTPFGMTGPDAQVLVKPIAELADGRIDLGVVLSLKALPELPPMEISYSGTPLQLVAGEDRMALTSYLGFKVLEQGVDALEKVQKEQERMAIEEEKLRKVDEERLTAFYAQRAELRLRQRELKVHSAQRILDVELAKVEVQRLIRDGEAINKAELRLRQRELRVHRKVLAEAAPVVAPADRPVSSGRSPTEIMPASPTPGYLPSSIDQAFFARLNSQTRMALERLRVPRVRSTSPTRLARVFFSARATSCRACQNSGSSESEVRWPAMVIERLSSGHQSSRLCLSSALSVQRAFGLVQLLFGFAAAEGGAVDLGVASFSARSFRLRSRGD